MNTLCVLLITKNYETGRALYLFSKTLVGLPIQKAISLTRLNIYRYNPEATLHGLQVVSPLGPCFIKVKSRITGNLSALRVNFIIIISFHKIQCINLI